MTSERTVAALIAPFKTGAIVDATGRSRQSVHTWRNGGGLPDVGALPGLARLIRIDLAELTQIVADEAAQRAAAVA